MSKTKFGPGAAAGHTPGPWRVEDIPGTRDKEQIYVAAGEKNKGPLVAAVMAYKKDAEGRANATLIASAPDLLREVAGLTHERDVARGACVNVTTQRDALRAEVERLREFVRDAAKGPGAGESDRDFIEAGQDCARVLLAALSGGAL